MTKGDTMTFANKFAASAGAVGLSLFAALPAWAQEAAPAAAEVVPTPDKGDTAWMITATVLVMAMIVPGLALFYGGLVRTKNMLSVLTQIIAVASLAMIMWVMFGYSLAFGGDANQFISSGKLFLAGVTADSTVATFTDGVVIPEFVFIAFQMTFSAITVALVLGGLVERMKFSAVMVFAVIWLTIVYYPIAHMVWYLGGDDASTGLIFGWGALDFAGGTVVHINAGIAALVGSFIIGKRTGYQKDIMAPHSLTMTLIGTGLLWVGWFGFNAGSALEANGSAGLALINTPSPQPPPASSSGCSPNAHSATRVRCSAPVRVRSPVSSRSRLRPVTRVRSARSCSAPSRVSSAAGS
jgi:Amt family ammonium transporter